MIDYICGILTEKTPTDITVEAHGVGYSISIPVSTYEKLPKLDSQAKVLTHHYVREDSQKLFGFNTKSERDIFRQLICISGIGPKVALAILSGVSITDLVYSVNLADATRLKSIPGVGPKTAQRIVMELKGKLGAVDEGTIKMDKKESGSKQTDLHTKNEAYEAMVSLGYGEKQVQNAVARVEKVIEPNAPVEEWIKKALQVI